MSVIVAGSVCTQTQNFIILQPAAHLCVPETEVTSSSCFHAFMHMVILGSGCGLQVDYVRAHKEVLVLLRIKEHGGDYAIALPGRDGRSLHARSQDTKRLELLKKRMTRLAVDMGTAPPHPESPEYKAAHQLLKRQEIAKLQMAVEEQVAALQILRLEREQRLRTSANNTASLNKAAERRRKNVQELLAVMLSWDADVFSKEGGTSADGGQDKAAAAARVFADVVRCKYPWAVEGAEQTSATLASLAAKYWDARAEADRCTEELQLVAWEMRQTRAYYQYVTASIDTAIDSNREEEGSAMDACSALYADHLAGTEVTEADSGCGGSQGGVEVFDDTMVQHYVSADRCTVDTQALQRVKKVYQGLDQRAAKLFR